jgi:hypothetical protein
MTLRSLVRLLPLVALVQVAAPAAAADCKADLVASQKALKVTGAGVEEASLSPAAGKCEAYRKHYAAMVKFREVLARCGASGERAAHVAQLNASIEAFKGKLPPGCKV